MERTATQIRVSCMTLVIGINSKWIKFYIDKDKEIKFPQRLVEKLIRK